MQAQARQRLREDIEASVAIGGAKRLTPINARPCGVPRLVRMRSCALTSQAVSGLSGVVDVRVGPYPLAAANAALDDLGHGRLQGAAVLVP